MTQEAIDAYEGALYNLEHDADVAKNDAELTRQINAVSGREAAALVDFVPKQFNEIAKKAGIDGVNPFIAGGFVTALLVGFVKSCQASGLSNTEVAAALVAIIDPVQHILEEEAQAHDKKENDDGE